MATDLFVYGTLQDPAVLGSLLHHPPPLTPVTVPGWRVAPVRGQVYPALVREPDAAATGHHLEVDDGQLAILDDFEGPAYERREVGRVTIAGRDRPVQAWVAGPEVAHWCEPGTWQLDGFRVDPDRQRWLAAIRRGGEAPRH